MRREPCAVKGTVLSTHYTFYTVRTATDHAGLNGILRVLYCILILIVVLLLQYVQLYCTTNERNALLVTRDAQRRSELDVAVVTPIGPCVRVDGGGDSVDHAVLPLERQPAEADGRVLGQQVPH